MAPDGRFCGSCGTTVSREPPSASSKVSDDYPVLMLHPVYLMGPNILMMIPYWGCFGLFLGFLGISGYLGFVVRSLLRRPTPIWMSWAALALLIVIAVHALVLWIGKKTYSLMEWRFYKDRLEYTIGIFGGVNETIPYARVVDVSLARGVIQKRRGLGTIVVTSTGGQRDTVTVSDIEDSENVYEQVRALALAR